MTLAVLAIETILMTKISLNGLNCPNAETAQMTVNAQVITFDRTIETNQLNLFSLTS